MEFPFYVGNAVKKYNEQPARLPASKRMQLMKPDHYMADAGLVDACNVALLLGQPLLLTGEPGTGKTQLAYSLAWELGFEEPLKFETKSTSIARDLFYTYDALRRFQDAQSGVVHSDVLLYLTYHALGIAILRTRAPAEVATLLPAGFVHDGPIRSVVLIDEVDKAPRDFPNDILNELEQMYFRVPELGNVKIGADPAQQPIVVFTSNSEKDLPDAFLRRCIYYNIPFPDRARMAEIVVNHLGAYVASANPFLESALDFFYTLRDPSSGLRKKPTTAEFLTWLITLEQVSGGAENPLDKLEWVQRTLSNLVKTTEDQYRASEIINRWTNKRAK